MKDSIDRMDKAIKDKFEAHEVPVPSHLWNSIESKLAPENDNGSGSFFFKNPFILSILFISTVLIGSYVFHSSNDKKEDAALLNQTSTSDNRSRNSLSINSTLNASDRSSTESNNVTLNSLSNAIPNINTEVKDQTASNIQSESGSTTTLFKNKEKNNIDRSYTQHTTIEAHSASDASEKNTDASTSRSNSHSVSEKNIQQHTFVTNQNRVINQTDGQDANTSSNNVFLKGAENKHVVSSSATSVTRSNSAETINISATSSAFTNTIIQTSNASTYNVHTTAYADSIKQYSSALMQELDPSHNSNGSASNMYVDNNTPTDVTKTKNSTSASASNLKTNLHIAQINNVLIALNAANALPTPSETASLYNTGNNETNRAASENNQYISNTYTGTSHAAAAYTHNDSVYSNRLENYFSTTLNIRTDDPVACTTNTSTQELTLKIDSTIQTEHTDTSTVLKQQEVLEVNQNEETTKKKTLFLSRCSFDGYVAPALGYMYLYTNNTNDSTTFFTRDRNKSADPGFGFTTGLRMNYALTQKIEIGIGLQYSSLSQQSSFPQAYIDSTSVFQGFTQVDSTYDSINQRMVYTSHFIVTDTTQNYFLANRIQKYTDKFQNLSIPIHIAYGYSISNKLSLIARTSLLINYQTYSVTYLNAADGMVVGHHSNKNLSLGGSFSVGCYYQFSKKCSVFAEPIVSYYFSNLFDKQASFKQKQLMLGLQTGIRLSF